MKVQVWAYPEELEPPRPAALAEQVRALGADAISVALTYHRARRIFPRAGRVDRSPGGAVAFTPTRGRYGRLVPEPTASTELRAAVERLREASAATGVG